MSFGQRRLWLLHELEPDKALYTIARLYVVHGALDIEALRGSLDEVIRRHEVLRSTLRSVNGLPMQHVEASTPLRLEILSLEHLPEDERRVALDRLSVDASRRPFALVSSPLFRAALVRLGTAVHGLILTWHHVATDRWSLGILHRELSELYASCSAGRPSPLPDLPIQYSDFAVWQQSRSEQEAFATHLSYWKTQLQNLPADVALPFDRPRPATPTYAGAAEVMVVAAERASALRACAARHRATPFMVCLAVLQTLVHRYTGHEDVVIGSPIAGRVRRELESSIGFFVNTLVLRGDLSDDPPFTELLRRVRRTVLDALTHQETPFERLVEELQPARNTSRSPLVQILLAYQNVPTHELRLGDARVEALEVHRDAVLFDLELSVRDVEGALHIRAQYQTELFDPGTIRRLLTHFDVLLDAVVQTPDARLSALPLVSRDEEAWLRRVGTETTKDYPRDASVHALFADVAAGSPDLPATTFRDRTLTYAQLDRLGAHLARRLAEAGVRNGDVVALAVERSDEAVAGMLGILAAGAAYLPVDPDLPPDRIEFQLLDADVRVVLTRTPFIARFASTGRTVLTVLDPSGEPGGRLLHNRVRRVSADDVAYVMYTSGSTGVPKGVAIPHRAIIRLVWADVVPVGAGDAVLQLAPLSFDAATFEVWVPLLRGARSVVYPDATLDLAVLERVIRDEHVTHLWLTASLFNGIVDARPQVLERVSWLLAGGEALSPAHVRRALEACPSLRIVNGYGPTESTTFASVYEVPRPVPRDARSIPIGRPIANTTALVLDRHGQLAPIGVPGELYIGGDGLARGYVGSPDLTAERFVTLESGGARLYRSGDIVRWLPDGNLDFIGRRDRQVKLRGYRIELGEIESVLGECEGVTACVVEVQGQEPTERLTAWVAVTDPLRDTRAKLRKHLRRRLPEFMVPADFVILDSLPLTSTGKLDRVGLTASVVGQQVTPQAVEVASSDAERRLLAIWVEILGHAGLGISDNFFDAGGHSILAAQVMSRANQTFGTELPLRALFETPTIRELAERFDANTGHGDWSLSVPGPTALSVGPTSRSGAQPGAQRMRKDERPGAPLSFAQRRLWFLDQLRPGSSAYSVPRLFQLQGPLDVAALRRALDAVLQRHEPLRTTFAVFDGEPRQIVRSSAGVPFELVVLDPGSVSVHQREREQLVDREVARAFDLSADMLMRALLVRVGEAEHWLLLTVHHIATDGWSMSVLARELTALYAQETCGPLAALPPLTLSYREFAVRQQDRLRGARLDAELGYWTRTLKDVATLELPSDRPRPPVPSHRAARLEFTLESELCDALRELARRQRATLFVTTLAAFQVMLAALAGQEDIAVGIPVAGRTRADIEPLIGFFVNALCIRTAVRPEDTFSSLIAGVRDRVIEALDHQELPFEKLVEELRLRRDLARNPLFQVVFALQNAPRSALALPGIAVTQHRPSRASVRFDLELHLFEEGRRLRGIMVYAIDLFDAPRAERMAASFREVLRLMVTSPDSPVFGLRLADGRSQVAVAPARAERTPPPRQDVRPRGDGLTDTEARLTRLWGEALGTDPGPRDDFFDLGGHSLSAVMLFARIEREFGRRLPLSDLFTQGTIEALARTLDRQPLDAIWSPLVPIRTSGSGLPLFLIHGLGGEVFSFRALAERLPPDRPVYGLQAAGPGTPGPDTSGTDDASADIVEMCRRYAEVIARVYPSGPCLIGGYSSGGVMALELAHQLQALGRPIARLLIIDGGVPTRGRRTVRHTAWSWLRHAAHWTVDDLFATSPSVWRRRLASKGRIAWARARPDVGRAAGADIRDRLGMWRMPAEYAPYLAERFEAFRRYAPQPFPGPIVLFRSRTGGLFRSPMSALDHGWRALALGGFEVIELPGSHGNILDEPRVGELARHVERCIEQGVQASG